MILNENLFEDCLEESKKIDIYGIKDGEKKYLYSTNWYSRVSDAIDSFREKKEVKVASIPDYTVKFSDYDKVIGNFDKTYRESVEECYIDEYLDYDNKREENEEEFYDDEFLFDEEEEKDVVDEDIDYSRNDVINAYQASYGGTKRDAINWMRTASEEAKKELVRGFRDNAKKAFLNDSLEEKKEVTEDIEIPAVSDEEIAKTEESPSKMVEDNAYSNAIIDALNDEWATVQKYQDIVNQLSEHEEFKQFIPVIEDIIKDEKNHVGNLQKVLNDINPTTLPDIKDGEHEAEEQMGEGLNERDKELFNSYKDEENK